jgi:putative acetyltransferase
MYVRAYKTSDAEEIVQLFYDTVREVNIRDYSKEQVEAWAPVDMAVERWMKRLASQLTYVAEESGNIVGFAQLEENGHIDCFYCHKDFQRKGVGTQLLKQIESKAADLGIERLFTEASITAKPFFESKGFVVVRKQEVELRNQKFINFVMEKFLSIS